MVITARCFKVRNGEGRGREALVMGEGASMEPL